MGSQCSGFHTGYFAGVGGEEKYWVLNFACHAHSHYAAANAILFY